MQETLYWFDGCERHSHGNGSLVLQASLCVVDDGSRTCPPLSASRYGQFSSDPAYIARLCSQFVHDPDCGWVLLSQATSAKRRFCFFYYPFPCPVVATNDLRRKPRTSRAYSGFWHWTAWNHPRVKDDSFVVYDWSVGFAGGPNIFLIHDVSDEIALPMAQHNQPQRAENGFGKECAAKSNG